MKFTPIGPRPPSLRLDIKPKATTIITRATTQYRFITTTTSTVYAETPKYVGHNEKRTIDRIQQQSDFYRAMYDHGGKALVKTENGAKNVESIIKGKRN